VWRAPLPLLAHRSVSWAWVKAVWRVFGGGSGLDQTIWFVNRQKYKIPFRELQDLRRDKRYFAGKVGQDPEKCGAGMGARLQERANRA